MLISLSGRIGTAIGGLYHGLHQIDRFELHSNICFSIWLARVKWRGGDLMLLFTDGIISAGPVSVRSAIRRLSDLNLSEDIGRYFGRFDFARKAC